MIKQNCLVSFLISSLIVVGSLPCVAQGENHSVSSLLTDKQRDRLKKNFANVEKLYKKDVTVNKKGDGYYGIWYQCGRTPGEYVYKYSGGLGTYCAKHRPLAIYCPEVEKTFFCYGGARPDNNQALVHMVSYYDHKTGMVPRPTILLDKKTKDAHDNPTICVDPEGYIWIFSTSHGTARPSYIHKSIKPYSVDNFERISPVIQRFEDEPKEAFINFSYFQPWYIADNGFGCFFTLYFQPAVRTTYFISSPDGIQWNTPVCISAMAQGSYQISLACNGKMGTAFNYHPNFPKPIGSDHRKNIYYIETNDFGKTWQTAAGEKVSLPLMNSDNSALVYDSQSKGRNVYLKDIAFDDHGNPVILVVESGGWQCGPSNDPRTWLTARWDGGQWIVQPAFVSDNNYDTGAMFAKGDTWQIVAPTAVGPQAYNPGGEMMLWKSVNQGKTWNRVKQLTANSPRNHNYARSVINANPDFCALWADGNGRQESISNLYFCSQKGDVYMLPRMMKADFEKPVKVELGAIH